MDKLYLIVSVLNSILKKLIEQKLVDLQIYKYFPKTQLLNKSYATVCKQDRVVVLANISSVNSHQSHSFYKRVLKFFAAFI